MPDLSIYKVDLDAPQPNGRRGESPRSAFGKYNNLTDEVAAELDGKVTVRAGKGGSGYVLNEGGNVLKLQWSDASSPNQIVASVDSTRQGFLFHSGNFTAGSGWERSANGKLRQWGAINGLGDVQVVFPIAFTTAVSSIVLTLVGNFDAFSTAVGMIRQVDPNGFVCQKRYINSGGATGLANQTAYFVAYGA